MQLQKQDQINQVMLSETQHSQDSANEIAKLKGELGAKDRTINRLQQSELLLTESNTAVKGQLKELMSEQERLT